MATYTPSTGQIWKRNGQYYRILGITSNTGDVLNEKIDKNGNKTSANSKPISKNDWIKRDYELEESFDAQKENQKDNSKDNRQKDTNFSFVYNPTTNKFSILKNGEFVTDVSLYTVAGANGMSAYEQWVNRLPQGTQEEEKSFDRFLNVLKGHDGKDAAEWTINEDGYWCCNGIPTQKIAVPKPGENGKSAYEVWAESQPIEKRSKEYYEDFIKGKDGKPGQSAFEAWKNLNPTERQNATVSDFFNWFVEQTEKRIDAKEGATWIPNIVDEKLVFTNERTGVATDGFPVKGKDGKSYTPNFIDGKLVFIDENGHEVTPRHEYRGKSAFEVWRDLPGNSEKTEKDFFDFLKGEKGDPGLDGINIKAKHSYLEIKDWTCPVQTIDTELITNLGSSSKSPDAIIDERMKEIEDKRKEGNELLDGHNENTYFFFNGSWWYKNWGGWFKEFSWWCAGADRPLLRMCKGDHSKYTGIGTVILFTALMAWFSSFVALKLVFDSTIVSAIFATFWSMMIFFLDRFITNTMYSDGKVSISKDEFVGGLPRILIAIFLGIVISAPLELDIFDKEIKEYIVDSKIEYNQEYKNALANLQISQSNIKGQLEDFYNNNLPRENDPSFTKPTGVTKDTTIYEPKQKLIDGKLVTYYKAKTIKTPVLAQDRNAYIAAYDSFKTKYEDTKRIAQNNIEQESKKFETYKDNIRSSMLQECDSGKFKSGLYERLTALHAIAMKEGQENGYKPLFSREKSSNDLQNPSAISDTLVSTNNKKNEVTINEKLSSTKEDSDNTNYHFAAIIGLSFISFVLLSLMIGVKFKNESKTYLKLVFSLFIAILIGTNYEIFHYIFYYLTTPIGLIMLLFILIDISPVLYKMMLADGVYDNYLHQEKLLSQDKIRLSLARMLRNLDKGELKSVSPFIMGKIYRKLYKYSVSEDGLINGIVKDYKSSIDWGENVDELNNIVEQENKKVFETVLNYKRRIILSSYAAWYRDMKDALIGSATVDPGNDEISPEKHLLDDANFENHNFCSDDEEKRDNSELEDNHSTSSTEDNVVIDDNVTEHSSNEETAENVNNTNTEIDPDVEEISDTQNEDDEKPNSDWDDDDVEHKL